MIRSTLTFFCLLAAVGQGGLLLHQHGQFCRNAPFRAPIQLTPAHMEVGLELRASARFGYWSELPDVILNMRLYAIQFAAVPSAVKPLLAGRIADIAASLRGGVPVVVDHAAEERLDEIRSLLVAQAIEFSEFRADDLVIFRPEIRAR